MKLWTLIRIWYYDCRIRQIEDDIEDYEGAEVMTDKSQYQLQMKVWRHHAEAMRCRVIMLRGSLTE